MAKCDINNKQRLFDVLKSKDIVDMANDNNIEYSATLSGNILNISVKSGVDNAYIVQSLIENAVNNSFPGILLSSRIEDGYINTILFTERVNNTIKDKRNKRIAKLRFDRSIVRNDGEVISPSGYPAIPMANDRKGIIKNLEKQIHQEATNAWDLGEVADVSNRGVGKLINEYYKSDVVSYYDEGTDLTFPRVQVPEFLVDIYYNELLNIIKERKEKWSSDLMEQSSFWDENGDVDQYNSISTTNTNITKEQYSQYFDSLNKPETNPILQDNQQEQVKKFAELQERLNNKEFLEGAKNAYESSKDLQEWGTQEEYNDYIVRVSLGILKNPSSGEYNNSQVKDIVYHGTGEKFDIFDFKLVGKTTKGFANAAFFTNDKNWAFNRFALADTHQVWGKEGVVLSALINIKNPKIFDTVFDFNKSIEEGIYTNLNEELNEKLRDIFPPVKSGKIYFVVNLNKQLKPEFKFVDENQREEKYSELTGKYTVPKNITEQEYLNTLSKEEKNNFLIKKQKLNDIISSYSTDIDKAIKGLTTKTAALSGKEDSVIQTHPNTDTKEYAVFDPEQIHILSSKADIQGFKDFVQGKQTFDKELAQKIQDKLQKLYPEIKLNITNNPVWEQGDNVFNQEEYSNQVIYGLKATKTILDNLTKIKQWESNKSIDKNTLWRKIGELGISKQQLDLLKESDGNTIEEKFTSFVTNYSYTVEIKTAKKQSGYNNNNIPFTYKKVSENNYVIIDPSGTEIQDVNSEIDAKNRIVKLNEELKKEIEIPTRHYSNLTVNEDFYKNNPDWEYKEQRITTPLITPSIKGHAQFAQDNDIGWFRAWYNKKTGEVHVLEVQSDLFQKGRDRARLATDKNEILNDSGTAHYEKQDDSFVVYMNDGSKIQETGEDNIWGFFDTEEEAKKEVLKLNTNDGSGTKANQFLQLLNKDNNWVTFFVKSIIQDTTKQTITEVQESDVESKVKELEKEGLLEIDCKGKLKAEKGLTTSFTKGGKWKIIKDLKDYPTHKDGGVDLIIGKDGVSIKNGNTQFTAKHGLVIPKN